ncbi:MAG: glucose-1-phosphate thymidylyltransferase, partial [Ignavibacteriae bacterium]
EEKPSTPRTNRAIPGLYIYTSSVCDVAATLTPSARGELEITSVHQAYLDRNELKVVQLGRGMAWLDTGTPESLLDASTFIHAIEKRQGLKIGCLEEVALRQGFLSMDDYRRTINDLPSSPYRAYCEQLIPR